ncbi:MAG: MarC family protein [Verrucomicrobiota bacterium]
MTLLEYIVFSFSSLFVIMDPITLVPLFLAMSPRDTPEQRIRTARLACTIAAGVLAGFALLGRFVFEFLGITLPAFQIAGSLVLLLIALDMLRARRSPVKETEAETVEAAAKEDIAVTPLAIPLLAGPGAISTTLLLHSKAATVPQQISLYACIAVVCIVSYFVLRLSAQGARWIKPIAMNIVSRLMGLLLAAIAVQFILNALRDLNIARF